MGFDIDFGAWFSECREWRYALWRTWGHDPKIAWIGLNPSTADETHNDPTVRRCINYSRDWGYGGMWMLNLFGLRSTDPKNLYGHEDPVGTDNDRVILSVVEPVPKVVLCWGAHGSHLGRSQRLLSMLIDHGHQSKLYVLGFTKKGEPKHPLYLSKDLPLIRYR